MTPHYSDAWLTVYHGDAGTVLAELPAESVNCVVTSPPYWGLRDYGTSDTVWDGELVCVDRQRRPAHSWSADGRCESVGCDSWRGSLGLEPTPELFVRNLVSVFREVWRVLRPDGTVWLNLGDSYAAGRGGTMMPAETLAGGVSGQGPVEAHRGRPQVPDNKNPNAPARIYQPHRNAEAIGLKHKDLIGIPWRVAFALQSDGWYLRSDIIWAKPNPMPESVTDRPTKSHEYLFLLSKSPRYYFDAAAVREADAGTDHRREVLDGQPSLEPSGGIAGPHGGLRTIEGRNGSGRNIRSVWTVATQPYPGAHFATFPPKLIEPCILAGCPEGGLVLDPFAGSGTTGLVAQRLSRRAVLIDLSMQYLGQLMDRNRDIPLGLVGA